MTTIRIVDGEVDMKVRVSFPYDANVVATIKQFVPGPFRSYDATTKTWLVHLSQVDQLIEAFGAGGHQILRGDEQPAVAPVDEFFGIKDEDRRYAKRKAAEIIFDIPEQHRGKVFREMSKILYPEMYRGR